MTIKSIMLIRIPKCILDYAFIHLAQTISLDSKENINYLVGISFMKEVEL